MFGNGTQKAELPLIIVCDDKDMVNANYLIQLIGQKDDIEDSVVGIVDGSVSAAIFTPKDYKDNRPQLPSNQYILFIGQSSVAKEQSKTIPDLFSKLGMHYGWLGKRAVLYVDNTSEEWPWPEDKKEHYTDFLQFSKERGMNHSDALAKFEDNAVDEKSPIKETLKLVGRYAKVAFDFGQAESEIKAQQYRTLIKVFYEDGLRTFMEG